MLIHNNYYLSIITVLACKCEGVPKQIPIVTRLKMSDTKYLQIQQELVKKTEECKVAAEIGKFFLRGLR